MSHKERNHQSHLQLQLIYCRVSAPLPRLARRYFSLLVRSVGVGLTAVLLLIAISEHNGRVSAVDRNKHLQAQETELFSNFNSGGVLNGPRNPTIFNLDRPARISMLMTYHWNSGSGAVPGTIGLRAENGKLYGPFRATGSSGAGGAINVNWTAITDFEIPAGTYTVIDSDPRTWSSNVESRGAGFARVRGELKPKWDPRIFVGRWIGKGYTCEGAEPDQIIDITYSDGGVLNALKVKGDGCVRTGELTWRNGTIVDDQIKVENHFNYLGGPPSKGVWRSGMLKIVNRNELRGVGLVFTRPSPADLVVQDFSIEPYEELHPEGTRKTSWRIRAEVRNAGSGPASERFRIDLMRRKNVVTGVDAPEMIIAGSRTYLQSLSPGDRAVIEWDTNRQTAQTSPPNIVAADSEISVRIDTENVISEISEDNNQATLTRLDCSGPSPNTIHSEAIWVEKSVKSSTFDEYYPLINKVAKPDAAVLCYIRLEAKRRVKNDSASAVLSEFVFQLENRFLKEYLEQPTSEKGRAAIDVIGEPQGWPNLPLLPGESMYIPEGIRRQYLQPSEMDRWEWLYPATHFFGPPIGKYHRFIPFLDVPFLLGPSNQRLGEIDDAIYGGRNASNVMHWATGLKYHAMPRDLLRDLFLGYEYWHAEGFDVLGEDSLNDLISEEAGRILGKQIAASSIRNKQDLRRVVDDSFREARAWAGAIVRSRQMELDALILKPLPPHGVNWKTGQPKRWAPWLEPSVRQRLADGAGVAEVSRTDYVNRLTDIYGLIYFADEWEDQNGPIRLTPTAKKMLQGKYDNQFKAAPKGPEKWTWVP